MAKNADLGNSLKVIMAAATDIGTVRKQNEDSFYFSEKYQFFILCDGMGGHNAGRLAAMTAAETLKDVLRQEKFIDVDRICEDIEERLPNPAMKLIASVRLANRRIFNYAIKYPQYKGMGTTLVAALIDNGWLYIAHVGDSRLYRLRQGELKVMTSDHSYLRELIEDRELSEKEAWQFRQKNVLTRAVGISPNIKIDLCMDAALPNDLYLLCSDGMYGALPNELILRVLTADHGSLQKTVDRLVNYAKNLDGSDNITAGTILVQDSTPPARHVSLVTKTIAAEPGKVSSYLDRFIKKSYPEPIEKKKSKVPLVAGLLVLLAIGISALVFYFGGSTPEMSEASPPSALVQSQPVQPKSMHLPVALDEAGKLVLVQARGRFAVDSLRKIKGIRVLDEVSQVNGRLPLYAGKYGWALTDSQHYVVYHKNNLEVVKASRLGKAAKHATQTHTPGINTNGVAVAQKSRSKPGRGHIFLIGDFSQKRYQEAKIYINKWPLGPVQKYLENGFYLRPGEFTLTIRDSGGKILKRKSGVKVTAGKIIPIEF